jgi:hypothetical protein
MPIDYSKWDELDVSSSDDEDEDNGDERMGMTTPRVTRLNAPTKVTFGGPSSSIEVLPGQIQQDDPKATPTPAAATATGKHNKIAFWTDRGGQATVGDGQRHLYWSQDRYSVSLRLKLQAEEKVASVAVEGILPYGDRCSAVGSSKAKLVCTLKNGSILLEGELPHPVHLGAEDDEAVDWSVEEEDSGRFLAIVLNKAVPMQGLSLWWRRPLMDVPEIDLVHARGGSQHSSDGGVSKEFLEAWEQAHKLFREKKQNQSAAAP